MPRHALEVIAFGGILLVVLYLLGRSEQQETMVPLLALYAFAGYRLLPALQQILLRPSHCCAGVLPHSMYCTATSREPGATISAEKRLASPAHLAALPLMSSLELQNVSFPLCGSAGAGDQGSEPQHQANTSSAWSAPVAAAKQPR